LLHSSIGSRRHIPFGCFADVTPFLLLKPRRNPPIDSPQQWFAEAIQQVYTTQRKAAFQARWQLGKAENSGHVPVETSLYDPSEYQNGSPFFPERAFLLYDHAQI